MASVNKVILIGNLGADPEKKVTGGGLTMCNLRIATTDKWTDKQGQKQEKTEWHRVVVFGPQADNCVKYLAKGRQAYIEGRIQTRSWDDQQGVKKYMTEIVADRVQFLGGSPGQGTGTSTGGYKKPTEEAEPFPAEFGGGADNQASGGDDDVPF
ncbi:MAG: single-stranded DNA-binding protein [Deltaproteobacteria bacterium]|nr:single-stranded DNA-binding protein [Deltaproteobacteria bacterium]